MKGCIVLEDDILILDIMNILDQISQTIYFLERSMLEILWFKDVVDIIISILLKIVKIYI